eukprot:gene29422-5770_t
MRVSKASARNRLRLRASGSEVTRAQDAFRNACMRRASVKVDKEKIESAARALSRPPSSNKKFMPHPAEITTRITTVKSIEKLEKIVRDHSEGGGYSRRILSPRHLTALFQKTAWLVTQAVARPTTHRGSIHSTSIRDASTDDGPTHSAPGHQDQHKTVHQDTQTPGPTQDSAPGPTQDSAPGPKQDSAPGPTQDSAPGPKHESPPGLTHSAPGHKRSTDAASASSEPTHKKTRDGDNAGGSSTNSSSTDCASTDSSATDSSATGSLATDCVSPKRQARGGTAVQQDGSSSEVQQDSGDAVTCPRNVVAILDELSEQLFQGMENLDTRGACHIIWAIGKVRYSPPPVLMEALQQFLTQPPSKSKRSRDFAPKDTQQFKLKSQGPRICGPASEMLSKTELQVVASTAVTYHMFCGAFKSPREHVVVFVSFCVSPLPVPVEPLPVPGQLQDMMVLDVLAARFLEELHVMDKKLLLMAASTGFTPRHLVRDGINSNGWRFETVKGPIIADRDVDNFRNEIGTGMFSLPEMVFNQSRLLVTHEASGLHFDFSALDALKAWKQEDLPPVQVTCSQEWRKSREHEIQQQQAVQITYDWTFTSPFTGTLGRGSAVPLTVLRSSLDTTPDGSPAHSATSDMVVWKAPPSLSALDIAPKPHMPRALSLPRRTTIRRKPHAPNVEADPSPMGKHRLMTAASDLVSPPAFALGQSLEAGQSEAAKCEPPDLPTWKDTSEQIDRSLLMERDPILFYDEVLLYESDLDDNGVTQMTAKVHVIPQCWHDQPGSQVVVLREVKHCEGTFKDLRAAGAPGEGTSYANADAASQIFCAVAPIGLVKFGLSKLEVA